MAPARTDAEPGPLEQYRLHFAGIPQRYEDIPGFNLRSVDDQFFTTDAQGHAQTLHNDFLVFSYIYGNAPSPRADEKPMNLAFGIRPAFSLGYLVNREGVTPGIRISLEGFF